MVFEYKYQLFFIYLHLLRKEYKYILTMTTSKVLNVTHCLSELNWNLNSLQNSFHFKIKVYILSRCRAMLDNLGLGTCRLVPFWLIWLWSPLTCFQTENNRDPQQLLSVGDSSELQWSGSVCVPVSEQVGPGVWRSGAGDRGDSSDEGHCPGNRWEQEDGRKFHYISD